MPVWRPWYVAWTATRSLLVETRRWSADRYQAWLTDALRALLLADGEAPA